MRARGIPMRKGWTVRCKDGLTRVGHRVFMQFHELMPCKLIVII